MAEDSVVIIGAGIVGLATAYRLNRRQPDRSVTILEKEDGVARHQTGRNSGVIHSGVYYTPGSLKAENCRAGKAALEEFCQKEDIPYEICGKVIVATDEDQLPALEKILENGRANGVDCEMIGPGRLAEIEPHAAGIQAIHVPESGIVDYHQVSERLAENIRDHGSDVITGARVVGLVEEADRMVVETTRGNYEADLVINCAGLYSDKIAEMSGQELDIKIVPFRGEYYEVVPEARDLCNGLIYPVPDRDFPFLGVHFTKTIDGRVECGPNAVLAFAREGYDKSTIDWREFSETLSYPGFQRLAAKYWKTGFGELWRSYSKSAFVRALQELVPEVRAEHLEKAPAGVRAQALRPDGELVDDFVILQKERVVNVCNAPSPAATAALNIATQIVDRGDV
jgi:L-2-hydroxyglutarate oxidase